MYMYKLVWNLSYRELRKKNVYYWNLYLKFFNEKFYGNIRYVRFILFLIVMSVCY